MSARPFPAPPGRRPDGRRQHRAGAVPQPHPGAPVRAGVRLPHRPVGIPLRREAPGTPGGLGVPVQARVVPGGAGTDPGELRLDLPVAADGDLPPGDLGDRPEHARPGRPALVAAPSARGARRAAGGRPQPARSAAFRSRLGLAPAVGGAPRPRLDRSGRRPAPAHLLPPAAVDRCDRPGLCRRQLVQRRHAGNHAPTLPPGGRWRAAARLHPAAPAQRLWRNPGPSARRRRSP